MVRTGTGRKGNGKPRDFSFPTAISRPFPSLVSVLAVYHPVVRRLVPVPTVSRPTVRPLPDCSPSHRLPSCSHPIHPDVRTQFLPSRISYKVSGRLFPFHLPPVFSFPIIWPWMQLYYAALDSTAAVHFLTGTIIRSTNSFHFYFLFFPLSKRGCFTP